MSRPLRVSRRTALPTTKATGLHNPVETARTRTAKGEPALRIRYVDEAGYFATEPRTKTIRAWVGLELDAQGARSARGQVVDLTEKNGAYEGVVTFASRGERAALVSLRAAFAGPHNRWDSNYSANYELYRAPPPAPESDSSPRARARARKLKYANAPPPPDGPESHRARRKRLQGKPIR